MNNPRLAGRYAKSLVDLAIQQNQLDIVYEDIKVLHSIAKSNRDFIALLRSPVIKPGTKGKIIESVTKDKVSALTSAFIHLLVIKGRESNLPEIVTAFIDQFNTIKGIHKVKITTAVPVSAEISKAIVEKVNAGTSINKIELETAVNDELIGGFVLETEGKLVDVSILKDLKEVKRQFKNNDYIHQIR